MKRRRRMYRPPRRRSASAPRPAPARPRTTRTESAALAPLSLNLLRTVVCGGVFVTLVALKLLLPDGMAAVRAALGGWLARDADFVSAFSAVGHAVSGEGGVIDSLEDAYVAVFGEAEAAEVSGAAEVAQEAPAAETDVGPAAGTAAEAPETAADVREYPPYAAAEQRILGFAYAAPLEQGVPTSSFGWREDPNTGREAFHYGVDLGADEGTAISCFADGTVGVVAESVALGKYLTVHHPNGIVTLYAHCSRITASSGAAVKLGDQLAEVGSTGNATGPHLHFEIHDGEEYLDPAYYLS